MECFAKTLYKSDPENPSKNEATTALYYKIAMKKEIDQLIRKYKRCMVPCNTLQKLRNVKSPVLPRPSEFKIKRQPGISPLDF